MSEATRDLFHYTSEGVDDVGWGCVYRAFQNACLLSGRAVPTMHDLLAKVPGTDSTQWIEPAQLVGGQFLPDDDTQHAVYCPPHSRAMRFTSPSDYSSRFLTPDPMVDWLKERLAQGCAVVIDNGTMGFTLARLGTVTVLVDPHNRRCACVSVFDFRYVHDAACLMALAVTPQRV